MTETTSKSLHGFKLLLAEDFPDNQLLISRTLKYLGASVDVANDGQEAVDKALCLEYDAILMDIQMPHLNGFEATEYLRAHHYNKPIIALTAHAMKEERDCIMRSGFNDCVTKPLERQKLVSAIQKASSHN